MSYSMHAAPVAQKMLNVKNVEEQLNALEKKLGIRPLAGHVWPPPDVSGFVVKFQVDWRCGLQVGALPETTRQLISNLSKHPITRTGRRQDSQGPVYDKVAEILSKSKA